MKVKVIDESHEKDLEESINLFLEQTDKEIIDIKFQTAVSIDHEEQIYCFSALIIYKWKKWLCEKKYIYKWSDHRNTSYICI